MTILITTYARMQPIHKGHVELVEKMKSLRKTDDSLVRLYLSPKQDNHKNPLSHKARIKYARQVFPEIDISSKAFYFGIYEMLESLADENWDSILFVVGEDRYKDMVKLVNKFDCNIQVINYGKRFEGINATKIRNLCCSGKRINRYLPSTLKNSILEIESSIRNAKNLQTI